MDGLKFMSRKDEEKLLTLEKIFSKADSPNIKAKAKEFLKGKTPTEYVRELRRKISKKYTLDELIEFYNSE
mgnify:CR=1 FL=1